MTHILEHVPAPGRYPEGSKITEIYSILGPAAEDIHGVIDKRRRMTFPSNRDISNAL